MWNSGKGVLSGKCVALNAFIIKEHALEYVKSFSKRRIKWEESLYLILRLTIWLQSSGQCGTGERTGHVDLWHDWKNQLGMRPTQICLTDSLERCKSNPKKEGGLSTNGAGAIGLPCRGWHTST